MDANFPRLFTVNEANGLLPMLRPLVEQILENIRRLKGVSETVIRREQLDPDAPNLMERLREDKEVLKLVDANQGLGRGDQWPWLRVQGRRAGIDRFPVHARFRSGVSLLADRRSQRGALSSHRRRLRRTQDFARRRERGAR